MGSGFMGTVHEIAYCGQCHQAQGVRSISGNPTGNSLSPCIKCGTSREILEPDLAVNSQGSIDLGRCPKCAGNLTGEDSGILWD